MESIVLDTNVLSELMRPQPDHCSANYAAIVSGRRRAGHGTSTEDALIAAIALTHRHALATRNTKDFLHIDGLTLHNPWQTASRKAAKTQKNGKSV